MLEWLFCPQHGLLRFDNILMLLAYGNGLVIEMQCLFYRLGTLVTRWL